MLLVIKRILTIIKKYCHCAVLLKVESLWEKEGEKENGGRGGGGGRGEETGGGEGGGEVEEGEEEKKGRGRR